MLKKFEDKRKVLLLSVYLSCPQKLKICAAVMESKGDAHSQPKHSKLTKFSCTSMQDSSLRIPINMPEELITEILLRLPVKSLLQYRCVSKSWLSLISSPQFVKTHLSICANNKYYTHNRLIFRESEDPPKYKPPLKYNLKGCSLSSLLYDVATESFDMEYPMKNNNPRYGNVVGSVNGLICFSIEEKKFYIWNPSIRKFKKLTYNTRAGYHIIMYGFGYDDVLDDYKMVVVYRYLGKDRSRHNETRVYSLNSDSWIGVDYFQSGPIFNKPAGLFVNGKFHWANTYGDFRSYNGWDLISIDLADGKCRKVEKPWYGEGDFDFTLCLGALGSDLSLFCNSWRGYADLWVMKEYGVKESWTKIFTINRSGDPVVFPFFPFFFMLNEREILFDFGSSFMIYNQKNDSIRYREVINCEAFQEVNLYVESLLWPFSVEGIKMQQ